MIYYEVEKITLDFKLIIKDKHYIFYGREGDWFWIRKQVLNFQKGQ